MRQAPDRFQLRIIGHHLLLDGWSNQLLLPELLALYRGDLLPDATPFADHVAWLGGLDHEQALSAWDEHLAGAEPTLLAEGAPVADGWPGRTTERLGPEETGRLTATAAALGVTANTVLQCCWALVLAERTGRPDVVFGAITSGRSPRCRESSRSSASSSTPSRSGCGCGPRRSSPPCSAASRANRPA